MKLCDVLHPPLLSEGCTVLNSVSLHLRLDSQPACCEPPPNFDHCENPIVVSLRDCTLMRLQSIATLLVAFVISLCTPLTSRLFERTLTCLKFETQWFALRIMNRAIIRDKDFALPRTFGFVSDMFSLLNFGNCQSSLEGQESSTFAKALDTAKFHSMISTARWPHPRAFLSAGLEVNLPMVRWDAMMNNCMWQSTICCNDTLEYPRG